MQKNTTDISGSVSDDTEEATKESKEGQAHKSSSSSRKSFVIYRIWVLPVYYNN
jgi:hypothetical protein